MKKSIALAIVSFTMLATNSAMAQTSTKAAADPRKQQHVWPWKYDGNTGKTIYDPSTKTIYSQNDNGITYRPARFWEVEGGWNVDWGARGCGFHGFGGRKGPCK